MLVSHPAPEEAPPRLVSGPTPGQSSTPDWFWHTPDLCLAPPLAKDLPHWYLAPPNLP